MFEPGNVLVVLREARDLVLRDWGSSNPDVDLEVADGGYCASVALCVASVSFDAGLAGLAGLDEAHAAVLRGAGVPVPDDVGALWAAVYEFNDSQLDRLPVVQAFDNAIALFESVLI